jgi:hypothetical protein
MSGTSASLTTPDIIKDGIERQGVRSAVAHRPKGPTIPNSQLVAADWGFVYSARSRSASPVGGPRRRAHGSDGAAAVEFALLLPLLLLLVFGTIDFGYLVNRNTVLNNAAREGVRQGIFEPDPATIEARVREVTSTLDQAKLEIDVSCRAPDGTSCPGLSFADEWEVGGSVIVELSYEHDYLTPAPDLVGIGSSRDVTATAEMRIEG